MIGSSIGDFDIGGIVLIVIESIIEPINLLRIEARISKSLSTSIDKTPISISNGSRPIKAYQ